MLKGLVNKLKTVSTALNRAVGIQPPPKITIPAPPAPQPRILTIPPPPSLVKPFFVAFTPKKDAKTFTKDTLQISETQIKNNSYEPSEKDGFTKYRPEVIAFTDFISAFQNIENDSLTSVGKLIDLQFQSLAIRRETLINTFKALAQESEEEAKEVFNEVLESFENKISEIENTTNFYSDYIDLIEVLKSLLSFKKTPDSFYDLGAYFSLREFFYRRMQYSYDKFEAFTSTKIFLQLLFDCRSIAENYSLNLLNLIDKDRERDFDPISLDTTYTLRNNFSFNLNSFSSATTPQKAWLPSVVAKFFNSLPSDPDDRIKLLTTTLTKEILISRNLKRNEVYLKNLGITSAGSPFPELFGEIGENIFVTPRGSNSLAELAHINPPELNEEAGGAVVLPLEESYIESPGTKTFIPGTSYLIDTILELNETANNQSGLEFNTKPTLTYVDKFLNRTNETAKTLELLFDSKSGDNALNTLNTVDRFLINFVGAHAEIALSMTGTSRLSATHQRLFSALFKMANRDRVLKALLFEYIVATGIAARAKTQTGVQASNFFIALAEEVENIREFSTFSVLTGRYAFHSRPPLNSGWKNLRPLLELMAKNIFRRVNQLARSEAGLGVEYIVFGQFLGASGERGFARRFSEVEQLSAFKSNTNDEIRTTSMRETEFVRIMLTHSGPGEKNSGAVNLFNVTHEIMAALDNQGNWWSNGKRGGYYTEDNSSRTRYRFISPSFLLLMTFEILSSMVEKYAYNDIETFGRNKSSTNIIAIRTNATLTKNFDNIVKSSISFAKINFDQGRGETVFSAGALPLATKVANNGFSNFGSVFSVGDKLQSFLPSQEIFFGTNNLKVNRPFIANDTKLDATRLSSQDLETLNRIADSGSTTRFDNGAISTFLSSKTFLNATLPSALTINGSIFQQRNYFLRERVASIRTKLAEESRILSNIIHILQVLAGRMNLIKDNVESYFNENKIQEFISNNNEAQDLLIIKNPDQARNSRFYFDETKKQIEKSSELLREEEKDSLFGRMLITEEPGLAAQDALNNLLAQTTFLNHGQKGSSTRKKILTIGIPTGFSKELFRRVELSNTNKKTFDRKQVDVISIDVYKRDTRYSDIVFKPKKFLFDLSLYYSQYDSSNFSFTETIRRGNRKINKVPLETYLEQIPLRDYERLNNPREVTLSDLRQNEEYSFLTDNKKRELFKNHFQSSMLELYINLVTGMSLKENTLLSKEYIIGSEFNETFKTLIDNYIGEILQKEVPAGTIEEILANKNIDREVRDVYRLVTFGTNIFEPSNLKAKINSPKLFERVFHLPVDTDDFVIDVDLTNSTQSGREALAKNSLQDLLETDANDNLTFKEKGPNEMILDDYFVTIETNF